jgi:nucleotide-binding universal stress UspA family protein
MQSMYKRILVPVNGSRASAAGLHEAIGLAQELGARMRLIHVIDKRVIAAGNRAGVDCAAGLCDALITRGRSILERARSLAQDEGVEVDDAISRFAIARAASAILADSEQWRPDLIVIGKRARSRFSRVFSRSDADLVSKDAHVPVLVVQVEDGL